MTSFAEENSLFHFFVNGLAINGIRTLIEFQRPIQQRSSGKQLNKKNIATNNSFDGLLNSAIDRRSFKMNLLR